MSDIQRLTLISDLTNEFPKNANNSFKVRLPERLTLPGEACLVDVPDRPGSSTEQCRHRHGSSYQSRDLQRDVLDVQIYPGGVSTGQFPDQGVYGGIGRYHECQTSCDLG